MAVSPDKIGQRSDEPSRELLLKAASDLMIEVGTYDVSLHAIARKAGVTAPLVKYYFGSKEGMLVALLERDTSRSLAQLEDLLAMPIDPVSKMRIHIEGIIRTYSRHPYMLGLLNAMLRGPANLSSTRIKESFVLPLIDAQRRIMEEGILTGEFRALDPEQVYFVIVGACQYLFASRVAFREIMDGRPDRPEFARDFASLAADVLLNGIRAR
jgi:TetR/AcrR family transcriptional regulator